MTPLPARPRRLHMKYVKNCSTDLDGPRDFPVCILKSFTFLKLPFNYLSFGTIFISCNFCFRLHCLLDQREAVKGYKLPRHLCVAHRARAEYPHVPMTTLRGPMCALCTLLFAI